MHSRHAYNVRVMNTALHTQLAGRAGGRKRGVESLQELTDTGSVVTPEAPPHLFNRTIVRVLDTPSPHNDHQERKGG